MEKGLGHKWQPLEKGLGDGKDRFELSSVSSPPPEGVIAAGKSICLDSVLQIFSSLTIKWSARRLSLLLIPTQASKAHATYLKKNPTWDCPPFTGWLLPQIIV